MSRDKPLVISSTYIQRRSLGPITVKIDQNQASRSPKPENGHKSIETGKEESSDKESNMMENVVKEFSTAKWKPVEKTSTVEPKTVEKKIIPVSQVDSIRFLLYIFI